MVKKNVKKTKTPKNNKQFTIVYTIGQDEKIHTIDIENYLLLTLDVKSPVTGEVISFPVVVAERDNNGRTHVIPSTNVGEIIYNWGFEEEVDKFKVEVEKMLKAKVVEDSVTVPVEDKDAMFG